MKQNLHLPNHQYNTKSNLNIRFEASTTLLRIVVFVDVTLHNTLKTSLCFEVLSVHPKSPQNTGILDIA